MLLRQVEDLNTEQYNNSVMSMFHPQTTRLAQPQSLFTAQGLLGSSFNPANYDLSHGQATLASRIRFFILFYNRPGLPLPLAL